MLRNIVSWSVCFLVVAILGCSLSSMPGTGGRNTAEHIEQTMHPDTPEGVRCYVCHKTDMPTADFHASFSTNCTECHNQKSWIAFNFPHQHWPLGIHREAQCNRCHTQMQKYDFTVWQCFGCHHEPALVAEAHKARVPAGTDPANCIACHKGAEQMPGSTTPAR